MIDVYKIGLDLYDNQIDKNGGLYEYNLICKAASELTTNHKILLIVNGKKSEKDINNIKSMWCNYDIHIFIITDVVALNDSLINECDYVLHQSYRKLSHITKPQYYSHVPELFHKYHKCDKIIPFNQKIDEVFFGGGLRDNEDIFDYLTKYGPPMKLLTKSSKSDDRISYDACQIEMAKYKFALIISRHTYSDIGFVTPRFIEAIDNWCVPIILKTYDVDNIFVDEIDKVASGNAIDFYNLYKDDVFKCSNIIEKYKHILDIRQDEFFKLIKFIDKEHNDKSENS